MTYLSEGVVDITIDIRDVGIDTTKWFGYI